ncbi:hypothetical protein GCM10025857_26750 [Alicyclobacillus contaminans]|uniref:hypothetical protein n=1 Tax=Alicyclobacillus contaminans TaxID=392016 RepID=UPI0012EC6241|nr:hypothetical protein [Alicyclobacillus contaminans]GMA51318.1 hypothetical protein GCM10025857_26750 [Alicyclobacillus contaminans]
MKRFVVSSLIVATAVVSSAVPAFASVLRNDSTSQTYQHVSNSGSVQAIIAAANKVTPDGYGYIVRPD